MIDLWNFTDNGEAKRQDKRSLCRILYSGDSHSFKRVFANDYYVVLRLDYLTYVEFKPKALLSCDHSIISDHSTVNYLILYAIC